MFIVTAGGRHTPFFSPAHAAHGSGNVSENVSRCGNMPITCREEERRNERRNEENILLYREAEGRKNGIKRRFKPNDMINYNDYRN